MYVKSLAANDSVETYLHRGRFALVETLEEGVKTETEDMMLVKWESVVQQIVNFVDASYFKKDQREDLQ